MKAFTAISAALLISSEILSGCSINRADSLRMLDGRAEYEDPKATHDLVIKEAGLDGFREGPVPVRTRPKVAAIWIHPHEMASHDYFWGGWMSVVVEPDQWLLTKPGELRAAPGIVDVTASGKPPAKPRGRGTGAKIKQKTQP